jgi:transcriptional regulator with XRE-family HTH domain
MAPALPGEGSRSQETGRAAHPRPPDGSDPGAVLAAFMERQGLTQAQLADLLGVDRTYVSKVLSGSRKIRDVGRLRQVARTIGVPPERFGLLPDPGETAGAAAPGHVLSGDVREDGDTWRKVRAALNHRRPQLTKAALAGYGAAERIAGTPLITSPGWMPSEPIDLAALTLRWADEAPAPTVTGREAESEQCRPLMPHGGRYPRYCHVIRDLDPPSLFENRLSYRLLDVGSGPGACAQTYGLTSYFAMVDVCETVAHEVAAAWLRHDGRAARIPPSELPFRSLVGDPFDLARRAVLPSIDTLTMRHDARTGESSLMLHRRNPDNVAIAGGMTHIIPAGAFQPSGIAPRNIRADFDIWHNILRELSEELLGNPEHAGAAGEPIDYTGEEPFASLNAARDGGQIRVWYLGLGLDPLTLAGEVLTVLVIDAEVFDEIFADAVAWNSEGDVVFGADGSIGVPWQRDTVYRLLSAEPLAPAAQACVELAWEHEELLLRQHE